MPQRSIVDLITAMGGLLVWAGHFAILYAVQTAFCTLPHPGWGITDLRIVGLALTVVAVTALGALARGSGLRAQEGSKREDAESARFLRTVGMATIAIGLLAMVWATLPLLLLPACGHAAA